MFVHVRPESAQAAFPPVILGCGQPMFLLRRRPAALMDSSLHKRFTVTAAATS